MNQSPVQPPQTCRGYRQRPVLRLVNLVLRPGSKWTTTERIVALAVASHANPSEDDTARPGYRGIAADTDLDRRTVIKAMKVLVNGDAARGLPPVFTRELLTKRNSKPKGFRYRLVEDAEALMKGRRESAARAEVVQRVGSAPADDGSGTALHDSAPALEATVDSAGVTGDPDETRRLIDRQAWRSKFGEMYRNAGVPYPE